MDSATATVAHPGMLSIIPNEQPPQLPRSPVKCVVVALNQSPVGVGVGVGDGVGVGVGDGVGVGVGGVGSSQSEES